jgi:hypothetical protein
MPRLPFGYQLPFIRVYIVLEIIMHGSFFLLLMLPCFLPWSSKVDFPSTQHLKTVGPNVKNANDCKRRGRHTTRGEYLPKEGHVERKRVSISLFYNGFPTREFLTHLSASFKKQVQLWYVCSYVWNANSLWIRVCLILVHNRIK